MSYTELEHGYQDLRSTSRPIFYVGDINTVPSSLGDPAASSLYRSSKRGELSDGCDNDDGCMGGSDLEGEGKQVLVGVCAMAKKSQSKPMKEILTRLEEFEYIKILVFPEEVILKEPVEDWPIVDCLISFHSKGFPLDKAIHYANLRNPFIINNLPMQYDIQDRRRVYAILDSEGIEIPRYAVLDRDSADPKHHELVESEDHVEVNGVTFNKPFVEKPVSAEDHNIYIYYPTSAGGGSQRLFRKIGSRSSVYSPESRVRKTGSYIYEDFMPTDGTDVKVYTVGPDYAHAEARKSPALDGKVERDSEGKEIRYPVILSNAEKLISRKVCLAFKQTVCGFDLLRANGKSFVCDVNGFSFVKNSNKYYDDCAKILGNMILRELAPTLHIPWSVPFQLDDPPIVPTTFGKMMELRCVVAVIRHGDRTPKQKMKVEVRHPKFFEIFAKYDGYKHGHVKLKRPKQLQEILDTARSLLTEIQHRAAGPELEEKQGKLEQLKSVLEMYGHFSGINRKVQMKYQPRGRPRGSSSDDGNTHNRLGEPSLVLILKWGGELTPAGRIQAEELGRIFRCMYPGGQGRHLSGEYAGAQGLGLLRLHSTFRHDLKIYASDEGRVQMTAAAFAKGLLALEGELTPILVQMVKSANTNGLLDNDCDSSKYQNMVKTRLHELLQQDREFTREDREQINPGNALSINDALDFVKNPVKCCQHVQALIQKLMDIVRIKKDDLKTKDAILYHGETWELMGRRWGKIEKDFCTKNKRFDISKIPDIYDCIKYDLQHNNHTLQFDHAEELYIYAKYLADIVIPQEYGLTVQEKLTIGQGICTPLLKKIRADLQRNIEESGEETVNRLNPRYSHGVSSPGRHVRTRLYFTSESHVHSLLTVLRYGGLLDVVKDEQWRRAMEYVSMVSELNYMSQIVVMLYEDPTKDPSSEERFHVELHFSPGVNCCVQKNLPPGPGFRPHSRNESSHNLETTSQCSTRIEEEDTDLGVLDDEATSPQQQSDSSPPLIETEEAADSTLDSPTTSRAIDMMDLDPNMMDEPYDSGFLQGSAPIPISARTVAGHEAARLGSQLAASQRQRREREASSICEPRARSYDHQRQDKPEKTDQTLRRFELDDLFYERVDNLVGSQSSRTIAQRYSPGCPVSSAGLSTSSSSPDLSVSLVKTIRSRAVSPITRKPNEYLTSEEFSSVRETPLARQAKLPIIEDPASNKFSLNAEMEFWDFGESQLLEKSLKDHVNEQMCEKSVGSKMKSYDEEIGFEKEDPSESLMNDDSKMDECLSEMVDVEPKVPVVSPIGRSKPRETPNSRTVSYERKIGITRSPSCLGIPVSLPHSVSSPELPAPVIVTILESSGNPVTLRNVPPGPAIGKSPTRLEALVLNDCNEINALSSGSPNVRRSGDQMSLVRQSSETKIYGRSKSALTLPTVNDARGEFGTGVTEIVESTLISTNDRYPTVSSRCKQSHCRLCEIGRKIGNDRRAKIERSASLKFEENSVSRKNDRRSSLTLPESRNAATDRPAIEGEIERSAGLKFERNPVSRENDRRFNFTNLSPNARRASLTVPINTNRDTDRSRSMSPRRDSQSKCSTSLPSRSHFPYREICSLSENKITEDDDRLKKSAICFNRPAYLRPNSLTVPNIRDGEILGIDEDIRQRRDRSFTERSRSLSPCLQRCLCYNCNVATLIQESVNLSPAERSNFQVYFDTSLSHKFINCSCYNATTASAEASRRVSRSASPNSTSARDPLAADLTFGRSLPCLDAWRCYNGRNNRNLVDLCARRRYDEDVSHRSSTRIEKSLERRRSSPHNLGAFSMHSCELRTGAGNTLSHLAGQKHVDKESHYPRIGEASAASTFAKIGSLPTIDNAIPNEIKTFCSDFERSVAPDSSLDASELIPISKRSSADLSVNPFLRPVIPAVSTVPSTTRWENKKSARLPPRQFSCPEIISESSSFSTISQRREIKASRRSATRQSSLEVVTDSPIFDRSTIGIPSLCLPKQFHRFENTNSSSPDNTSHSAKSQKSVRLLRQFSCPEMSADSDLASRILSRRTDAPRSTNPWNFDECIGRSRFEFSNSLHAECSRYCRSTASICKNAPHKKPIICYSCTRLICDGSDDCCDKITAKHTAAHTALMRHCKTVLSLEALNTNSKDHLYKSSAITSLSSSSHPRLQTQRSFSSPDTRPSIIQQPDPTCTARRHRHGISGQMSYFKLLGYNVSKKLTGSANSLFSTAVISGSSSAPNLKDMVPPHASAVAAIEGFGGVPPIRPLETLHNALSLRQLDSFLDMMTSAPLFRTPASSPPKFPSPGGSIHGGSVVPNLSIGGINREYHTSDMEAVRYITPAPIHYKSGQEAEGSDLRNQLSPISPNSTGWSSEPQSFLSSEPSSPAPTSAGECSMSMSLVSNDGTQPFTGGPKFPANPCLDIDFNDFCMSIDQESRGESRGSISYTDYYSNEDGLIRKSGGDFANLRERATRDEGAGGDSIVDEDEEHTLTLRQTEEEQKRDVKFIFEQSKEISSSLVKPGSSFKKIGRFRVESMEITDEDVRIKEAAAAAAAVAGSTSLSSSNLSLDRARGSSTSINDKSRSTASIAGESVAQDTKKLKGGFSSFHSRPTHRGKTIARSQSVTTPQNVSHKTDVDYTCQTSEKNVGSFSTMSCEDLENWKLNAVSPTTASTASTAPIEIPQDEPILTLASSLKGVTNITVGFNVQDNKKD